MTDSKMNLGQLVRFIVEYSHRFESKLIIDVGI
jgi:hypothetical protein